MTQLPLGLVRNSDPDTSVRSAFKSSAFRASHEAKIFSAIADAGARGATYREIAAITGMEPVAVARRLRGMEKRGLICRRIVQAMDTEHGDLEQRDSMCVWRAT